MKYKLLTVFGAAALLTACSTNESSTLTTLRLENHALKRQLVALGKDTSDVLAASLKSEVDNAPTSGASPQFAVNSTSTMTLGTWKVNHYVDDFGAPTKDGYITTETPIAGTFSNSATQDSELLVALLIEKNLSMAIQLYEYARNNPVKAYGSDSYDIKVRDKDGKNYSLRGTNYESDRLRLDKADAMKLHNILLKGGKVQFVIRESDTPTTVYNFAIDNADGYLNARKELKKS